MLAFLAPVSAGAQVPSSQAAYSGYSTGTAVHADALQLAVGGPRIVDGEVAFSGASANSQGIDAAVVNEMSQAVQPAQSGKKSYGRGSGLELGVGTSTPNTPDANQLILSSLAEAAAPPSTELVTKEVGPVAVDPLAYASLLRGQAQAIWNETCVIGQPISYGLGYAADAQLLNAGGPGPDSSFAQPVVAADTGTPTDRTVSQSKSYTYLASNGDGTWGLVSETRQTLAPVTLFKGTATELTIELLGEWVLRATATGKPGGAKVEYAPAGSPTPTTPILRILQPASTTTVLTFQQVFGESGLTLPVNPLVNLAIGEAPRRIAAPGAVPDPAAAPETAGDGTLAAGAVDVVRVNLIQPDVAGGLHALDLRIGHMEARAAVPAGGITCTIPVKKETNVDPVNAGQDFTWTITIPSDAGALAGVACDLLAIKAVDTVEVVSGSPRFTLVSASNGGVISGGNKVTWENLGDYRPGSPPIVLTINGHIPANSGPGQLKDTVDVTATLGNCTGGAAGDELVGQAKLSGTANVAAGTTITGRFTLDGPRVGSGGELPVTGGTPFPAVAGLGLLALGAGVRRLTRQRSSAAG